MSNFKEEAYICSEQRLGRLEDHIISVKRSLARLEGNQQETNRLDALKPKAQRTIEGGEKRGHASMEIRMKEANLGVLNMTYKLLTSSKAFDSRTGKGEPTAPQYSKYGVTNSLTQLAERTTSWFKITTRQY